MISQRNTALLLAVATLLSVITVYIQFKALGTGYLESRQLQRHEFVLNGKAGDPWVYRVFSEWLVELVLDACRAVGASVATGFLFVRFVQNVAIFIVAFAYYRALSLPTRSSYLALGLLAWSMTQALYDSDLQFNTYSDLVLYLAAALLIVRGRWGWTIPLIAVGALNRETIGLVPLMLVLGAAAACGVRTDAFRRAGVIAAGALATYAFVAVSLKAAVGPRPPQFPPGGWGFGFLVHNTARSVSWVNLFSTLNVLPVLAACWWRSWPRWLTGFAIAVVPLWFLIHFLGALVAETRLFLIPMAVVFIPGALSGLGLAQPAPIEAADSRASVHERGLGWDWPTRS